MSGRGSHVRLDVFFGKELLGKFAPMRSSFVNSAGALTTERTSSRARLPLRPMLASCAARPSASMAALAQLGGNAQFG